MSLRDKASKVNFSFVPGAVPADEAGRPKTAPGAMMAFANDQRSELLKENDVLRERAAKSDELEGKLNEAMTDLGHWEGAKPARFLDTSLVRASRFANRHASSFESPDFKSLKTEIEAAGGNVQPIKVRPITGDGEAQFYEIVFGHRRYEACRQLGLPVLAVVDNVDDQALFAEMDRENRARQDLSPWEQGVMYRRALAEGLFPSNRKMADALGVDLSALGRTLMLADLPTYVVAAFRSPLDLQFRWAKPLHDVVRTDLDGLKARAERVSALPSKPSSKLVFETLVGQGRGVEPFHPLPPVTIEVAGRPAATVAFDSKGAATVTFKPGVVSGTDIEELSELLTDFLARRPKPQTKRVSARKPSSGPAR